LRERWPEILEAVKRQRRVAWILLSNATVDALEDNILTLRFSKEGEARGFAASDYDQDLGHVLRTMLGISPKIKAVSGAAPTDRPGNARGESGVSGAPAGPDAGGTPAGSDVSGRAPASPGAGGGTPGGSHVSGGGPSPTESGGDAGGNGRGDRDNGDEAAARASAARGRGGTGAARARGESDGGGDAPVDVSGDASARAQRTGRSRGGVGAARDGADNPGPSGGPAAGSPSRRSNPPRRSGEDEWVSADDGTPAAALTGIDLIRQTLGGEVIEEIGDA
jgi:DNA polymerase-3 subunit gamma/tau